jgi:hypothetical protein
VFSGGLRAKKKVCSREGAEKEKKHFSREGAKALSSSVSAGERLTEG